MDPISAIGVAAAVTQFVGQAIVIAKRIAEYSQASPLEVPRPLQGISTRLPLLVRALERMQTEEEVSQFDVDSRCILRGVISGCMRLIGELDEIAQRLVPQAGESMRTRVRKAFSSLNSEEKIASIDASLQTYIQVLILHHVVDKRDFDAAMLQADGFFEVKEKLADNFERRKDLIAQLDQCFYDPIRRQADQPRVAVLSGPTRSGKTQLAAGYCRESFDIRHFHLVFWLDASSAESFHASLQSTAIAIKHSKEGTPKERAMFTKQFLANNWEPWLIVLDNYNPKTMQETECIPYLPKKGYGGIIIITESRQHVADGTLITVPKYLNEDEIEYFRHEMSGAIERSDVSAARPIIESGFDVNQKVDIGWSFLARAALMGSEPMVMLLLEHGANHIPDPATQRAALEWAASHGYVGVVTLLLDQEDRTQKFLESSRYHDAALMAIEDGHTQTTRSITSRRDLKLSGTNPNLGQSFRSCARRGKLDMVKYLVSIGAVPGRSEEKADALVAAIEDDQIDMVKFLVLEAGFPIDTESSHGSTALIAAACLQSSRQSTVRDELVTLFVTRGADVNYRTRDSQTALQAAALRENVDTVKQLLYAGADPTVADNLGFDALLLASKYKSPASFPPLINVEFLDDVKRAAYLNKALFFAARWGDRELLAAVAEKVDVNAIEEGSGNSPLILSIKGGHGPVARYLIRRGANPAFKDSDGIYPLLLAAQIGLNLVVRDLAKSKESPGLQVKDAKGNSALHLAVAANRSAVVEDLIKAGADVNAENNFGEVAMDIAEENKLKDIIAVLENTTM